MAKEFTGAQVERALERVKTELDGKQPDLGYVTPEMFGAKGDGVTDDTQAIRDMFASDYVRFSFGNKTYITDGAIDVTKACRIDFNNTTLLAKSNRYIRDFEYMLGLKAGKIYTYGRVNVNANSSVNICVLLSEAGGSHFDTIHVGNARIWGLYCDKTTDGNNSIQFKHISAGSCGQKIHAKGKYLSSTTLEVTEMTGFSYNDFIESLFDNRYRQNEIIIDDSLYTQSNLRNRYIFYTQSTLPPFTLDEENHFKGVFQVAGVGNTVPSNYIDGENGRDVYIPIGGGICLGSMHSEGAYKIDYLSTASNALSLYVYWGYGGYIGSYVSEYDMIVMRNESLTTAIGYLYVEGTGSAFKNRFSNGFDRIIEIRTTLNGDTYIQNPFIGQGRMPFDQGNNVVLTNQLKNYPNSTASLYAPEHIAARKLSGLNIAASDTIVRINCNEYTQRAITISAPGYAAYPNDYNIQIDLYDLNAHTNNQFEPLVLYVRRTRTDVTTYIAFGIKLSQKLLNAGYSLYGAINNLLTINPVDYGNHMKITIILFLDTKTFYVTAEPLSFVTNGV